MDIDLYFQNWNSNFYSVFETQLSLDFTIIRIFIAWIKKTNKQKQKTKQAEIVIKLSYFGKHVLWGFNNLYVL